ncbi:hypothetical protein U1Q18_006341 [Sarracenia purpurea var. burkii]
MGFLHKLWDETLAGPPPESGLGKLRKYDSFSAARSSTPTGPGIIGPSEIPVTRTITILRTKSLNSSEPAGSLPSSPAGSSTPTSPLSPTTPRGDFKRLWRRKSTMEPLESADPISPTVYDWFSLLFFLSEMTLKTFGMIVIEKIFFFYTNIKKVLKNKRNYLGEPSFFF